MTRISAIVTVSERYDEVATLFGRYRSALEQLGESFEMIYVLDGQFPDTLAVLKQLQEEGAPVRIVQLARWFGEATALTAGCAQSRGEILLTLPAYEQVEPEEFPRLVAALEHADMVVGYRHPRIDSWLNRFQAWLFNSTVHFLMGTHFHDLGCGVRAVRREAMREIPLYGDQHRFLPLLAHRAGFRVREVAMRQSPADAHQRLYRPGIYVRRALDVLTIFFLLKFTKKPLRFFGLVGSSIAAAGGIALLVVVAQRVFGDAALAERPALLLASLMLVLGIQLLALGLIGELIIYTHAREMKEYSIDVIIENGQSRRAGRPELAELRSSASEMG